MTRVAPFVTQWFGPHPWGPALDPDDEHVRTVRVPTPVSEPCLLCEEPIEDGDSGLWTTAVSGTPDAPVGRLVAEHAECQILSTSGHSVGLCRCTGYEGLTRRQAAIEAAKRLRGQL